MNAAPFAYERAESLQHAIELLGTYGEGAKLIAGGHSLLPIMKLRLAEPERLIDLGRVQELKGIEAPNDVVTVRALTTHHQIATDPLIAAKAPLLGSTAARIGDRQVRNRGTIGGALAHADAASDYPAAILALESTILVQGPRGSRRIPAREFFLDFLTTALEPEEVLTGILIEPQGARTGWSYQKLANQASGYPIVGVAAMVALGDRGEIADARVGVTGASAVPWRATATEEALVGHGVADDVINRAAGLAGGEVEMLDDLHGSAEYRLRVTRGLIRRAVLEAAARARNSAR